MVLINPTFNPEVDRSKVLRVVRSEFHLHLLDGDAILPMPLSRPEQLIPAVHQLKILRNVPKRLACTQKQAAAGN